MTIPDTTTARHFPRELLEQPSSLARTDEYLADILDGKFRAFLAGIDRVIWTGSGDCYFVGFAIAAFFERFAGLPAVAVESYDFVTETPSLGPDTLVIGFSSSGKSIYTVEALEKARLLGARTIAVTNTGANRLSETAAVAITTQAGRSFSFPTKTSTAALLVGFRLAELLGDVQVSAVPRGSLSAVVDAALRSVSDASSAVAGKISAARRVVVVGGGLSRTAALIGAAKLIETSEIAASANNPEEFLHLIGFGVREVDAVVVIDDGNLRSRLAAQYAVQQGAHTVVITAEPATDSLPAGAHLLVSDDGDDLQRLFSDTVILHALAAAVSANRGTNPDIPAGVDLDYVIGLLYTDAVDGWNAEAAKGIIDGD